MSEIRTMELVNLKNMMKSLYVNKRTLFTYYKNDTLLANNKNRHEKRHKNVNKKFKHMTEMVSVASAVSNARGSNPGDGKITFIN